MDVGKIYILLSHIRIHNANAHSSLYTIGVPAMTAWLGAVHALQRRIRRHTGLEQVSFVKTGISCHRSDLQVCGHCIAATANPLHKSKKTGKWERPPFIPEPRIHLEVSLLLETEGLPTAYISQCIRAIQEELMTVKMASGDVENVQAVKIFNVDSSSEGKQNLRKILRLLMPGYVLIERRDLLQHRLAECRDTLDQLLYYLAIHQEVDKTDTDEAIQRKGHRAVPGWIVPIAVGYRRLTPLGQVLKQRDSTVPHCFAEPLVTLGQFVMPYRFSSLEKMMWSYTYDETLGIYVCKNQ